jgi:hypothetical protein
MAESNATSYSGNTGSAYQVQEPREKYEDLTDILLDDIPTELPRDYMYENDLESNSQAGWFYEQANKSLDNMVESGKYPEDLQEIVRNFNINNSKVVLGTESGTEEERKEKRENSAFFSSGLFNDKQLKKELYVFIMRKKKLKKEIADSAIKKLIKLETGKYERGEKRPSLGETGNIRARVAMIGVAEPALLIRRVLRDTDTFLRIDFNWFKQVIPYFLWPQAKIIYLQEYDRRKTRYELDAYLDKNQSVPRVPSVSQVPQELLAIVKTGNSPAKRVFAFFKSKVKIPPRFLSKKVQPGNFDDGGGKDTGGGGGKDTGGGGGKDRGFSNI